MSIIKLFYRNPSAPQKASSETGIDFCTGSLLKKNTDIFFPSDNNKCASASF